MLINGWSRRLPMAGALCLCAVLTAHSSTILGPGFGNRLAEAALERTSHKVRYDPSYVVLDYPRGDVPADQGVCADVVVRSLRQFGIDLQQLVHLDMQSDFRAYPTKWGLKGPDPNIDHRRVLNLRTYFSRQGFSLPVTMRPRDYWPGDLVTWTVPPNLPHIGIVSNRKSPNGERYMIVHNIGYGPKLEDRLFEFPITGHYRLGGKDETPPIERLTSRSGYFLFAEENL